MSDKPSEPPESTDWGCVVVVLAIAGVIALTTICDTLVKIYGH